MPPDLPPSGNIIDYLGSYRILRLLGENWEGSTYQAECAQPNPRFVAIKVFHADRFPQPVEPTIRHMRQLVARVEHPAIVRLLDHGISPAGLPFLVTEYVDGVPIDLYCDRNSFTLQRRLELFLDVLTVVEYAHRQQVIHTALNPSSILVTEQGSCSLRNFGIASVLLEERSGRQKLPGLPSPAGMTESDEFYKFASPGRQAGEHATMADDVFSLGAVAHSLLTGMLPSASASLALSHGSHGASAALSFRELAAVNPVVLKSIAVCRGQSTRTFLRAMRGDLEAILNKALRIDPLDRFESVQHMSDEVRSYLGGYPSSIRSAGPWTRLRGWMRRRGAAGSAST